MSGDPPTTGDRICPECRVQTDQPRCPHDGFRTVSAALIGLDETTDSMAGTVFQDRYRIEKPLGRGGMGAVYLATQLAVNRPVALKILARRLTGNLKAVARFEREARAIAQLQHPNTVRLVDFGLSDDGDLFLVMEHLEGETLAGLAEREAPLAAERVLAIAEQILEALAEAHAKQIVHRDLKPQNLFVTEVYGKRDFIKLLDFGIAKLVAPELTETDLTGSGMALGSPMCIAPEQATSQPITPATDLYALGCILYELLAGRPPYLCETVKEYLLAHVIREPAPLAAGDHLLEGALPELVARLMSKQPEQRPSDAEAALALVREIKALAPEEIMRPGARRETWQPALEATEPELSELDLSDGMRRALDPSVQLETGLSVQAGADTVASSSELSPPPPSSLRRWIWPATVVVAAIGAVVAWRLVGPTGDAPPAPPRQDAPTASRAAVPIVLDAAAEPVVGTDAGPSATPDAAVVAVDVASADVGPADAVVAADVAAVEPPEASPVEVAVSVVSVPKGAQVMRGDEALGTTPALVRMPRAAEAIELTLRLDGYRDATLTVVPDADKVVEGRLVRAQRRPGAKKPKPKPKPEPDPKPEPKPTDIDVLLP